jgi:hypothetical protein
MVKPILSIVTLNNDLQSQLKGFSLIRVFYGLNDIVNSCVISRDNIRDAMLLLIGQGFRT